MKKQEKPGNLPKPNAVSGFGGVLDRRAISLGLFTLSK
jgi:hypothetical protein